MPAKRKHSPPIRHSKQEREISTFPKQKSSSNCDVQQEIRQANLPAFRSASAFKSKIQLERNLFFSKNLNFFADGRVQANFGFWGGLLAGGFWGFGDFGEVR